jgi:hypothetical protein
VSDPINPKHYDGTACAQIGERMTGNSYQVLKYNWRLGKKDDPVIETGKSLWYLDREIAMGRAGFVPACTPLTDIETEVLLVGIDDYVKSIVWMLTQWNRNGNVFSLPELRKAIIAKRAELEQDATGQRTMQL